jgi:Protein of unknown function (DUF2637)
MSERASDAPEAQTGTVPAMRDNRYWKMAATLLVAAFAAVISYNHIYDLGLRYGGDRITAHLLPLVVDGTVAAVSRVMLADYTAGDTPHWLTWFGLAAGVGATVAANVAYGLQYGVEGAVIWAIPPVMFVISAEITMIGFKRESTHPDAPASKVRLASVPDEPPSVRAIMREHRVGRPRAKEIRAALLRPATETATA